MPSKIPMELDQEFEHEVLVSERKRVGILASVLGGALVFPLQIYQLA